MIHPNLTYMFFVSGIMDDVDQAFYPEDFTALYLHLHIILRTVDGFLINPLIYFVLFDERQTFAIFEAGNQVASKIVMFSLFKRLLPPKCLQVASDSTSKH